MNELGIVEDEIFKKRQQTEEMFRARDKAKRKRMRLQQSREHRPTHILSGQYAPTALGGNVHPLMNPRQEAYEQRVQNMHTSAASNEPDSGQKGVKRSRSEYSSDEEDPHANDEVRLWESGFKDRYYESKFDVTPGNIAFRRKVALEYAKGLCWVLHYYFQGCPSWNWYFPYHYAPFASDFFNISGECVVWEKGTGPFRPLEQLMSVFPAASRQHVPEPWGRLMIDPFSPIIDFYPEDFKVDLNGKKFAWQGVALLPFVDEKRLHKALDPLYAELTDEEARRNCRGDDRLFVCESNVSFPFIKGLYENDRNYDCEIALKSDGVCGHVLLDSDVVKHGGSLPAPIRGLEVVRGNKVLCVRFRDAKYTEGHIFPSKRLPQAVDPSSVLKPQNLPDEVHRNWKPQIGMVPATQVASLGMPGHRMLGHYANVGRNAPGQYSAVAPPSTNSYVGGRDYGSRGRNSFHNSNSYHPYKDRRTGHDSRQQNYHSNSDHHYRSDQRRSAFSQQRGAEKDSADRYASRSEGYSSTNRVENSTRPPPPGYAVSYTVNADRSSQLTRPPYQSGNRGYQQYNPNSRSGGPRPAGFYRNHDQRHQPRDDSRR